MKYLLLILLTSCLSASKAARDHGLLPTVRLAWGSSMYGVLSDTERGIEDAVEDGDLADPGTMLSLVEQMTDALRTENRSALRMVPWDMLHVYADRGIQDRVDDGEMVPQAAVSLRRRLKNFDDAIEVLTDPNYIGFLPMKPRGPSGSPTVPTPLGNVPLVAVAAR